jgi:hypothetical protein
MAESLNGSEELNDYGGRVVLLAVHFAISVRPLVEQFRLALMSVFGISTIVAFGISWTSAREPRPTERRYVRMCPSCTFIARSIAVLE